MSLLRTKIFVAIFTVLAMTAQPYMAFAQVNWAPPDGPPLGNNVDAPVNVGPITQTKEGSLFIGKQGSTGLAVPFSNAMFGFYSQQLGSFPSTVNLYGDLMYHYPGQVTPPRGTVLSPDANGIARWVDIYDILDPGTGTGNLPNGNTTGQTLYWDQTAGTWRIASNIKINPDSFTSFSASGQLGSLKVNNMGSTAIDGQLRVTLSSAPNPAAGKVLKAVDTSGLVTWGNALNDGNANGDILVWNETTQQWEATSLTLNDGDVLIWNETTQQWESTNITNVTGALPPGTDGQTMVNNNGVWNATDKIKHPTALQDTNFDGFPDGYLTQINNDLVSLSAKDFSVTGIAGAGKTRLSSPETYILSPDVYFRNVNNQTVTFESNEVRFVGPTTNNNWDTLDGRLLVAKDDQGSIKWSKGLQYQEDFEDTFNIFGVVDDVVDANDIPLLWSEGLTFLQGDTTIDGLTTINNNLVVSTQGDLFLEGVNYPSETDNVKHLCLRMSDKQVVRCEPQNVIGENPTTTTVTRTGAFTETFGPGSGPGISFPRPNQAPGDVTVEMCGAGGGGGGGGRGWEDGSENGHGGGGGGGGGKGQCSTTTISGANGTELTWNIGSGGTGGSPGNIDVVYQPQPSQTNADTSASSGQPGAGTQVSYEGNQIGSVLGGAGGYAGANASGGSGPGVGGSGGSSNINIATAGWHKGTNGQLGSDNSTEMGQGGNGGRGEDNVAGQGGVGGSGGQPYSGSQFGGPGQQGASGYGGGGGGGGSGKWYDYQYTLSNQQNQDNAIQNHGGWGGNGGSGYVQLTYYVYIEEPAPPTNHEFLASGTFNISEIPTDVTDVTIEAWGGGGGGGLAQNAQGGLSVSQSRYGGGGGAGGYAKTVLPRSSLTPTLAVVVGAGGAVSADGGVSSVQGGGLIVSAAGGQAGADSVQVINCPAGGLGGSNNTGLTQTNNGGAGGLCGVYFTNQLPQGVGVGGIQSVGGYGNGGVGSRIFGTNNANVIPAQPGGGGRVYISW